jgi:5-hydroxyisourate hydrolase
MPKISTHVLDTANGRPAAGIAIELRRDGCILASASTNTDGRTGKPLFEADAIEPGVYEMKFGVSGISPFYGVITVRFVVQNGNESYHIPLLLSPYGYSTYRGS